MNKNPYSNQISHVFSAKWDLRRINSIRPNLKEAEAEAGVFLHNVFSWLKLENTGNKSAISLTTTRLQTKLRDEKILSIKDTDVSVKRVGISQGTFLGPLLFLVMITDIDQ